MTANRTDFEAWISGPPYELACNIFPPPTIWEGQYKSYRTQLAWEAWQECAGRDANELDRLRAELAGAKRVDCTACAFYYACFTGRKVVCCDGNEFDRLRDPVRLYEIDAAMAGGA